MSLLDTLLRGFILANSLICIYPTPHTRRDVNELQNHNLSLVGEIEASQEYAAKSSSQKATIFSEDISPLDLAYLPPAPPSNEYFLPISVIEDSQIITETPLILTTTGEIMQAESETVPFQAKNYLSPATETEATVTNEEEDSPAPFNEYLPPVKLCEDFSEIPIEQFPEANDGGTSIVNATKICGQSIPEVSFKEVVEVPIKVTQDTAILELDGYHYKVPNNIPDLVFYN